MAPTRNKSNRKTSRPRTNTTSENFQNSNQGHSTRFRANKPTSTFTGGFPDLKGNIYDCTTFRQADRYITTTKAVVEYIGRTFTHSGDIRATVENEQLFVIDTPDDPAEEYSDSEDDEGNITQTAIMKVPYVDNKVFELELSSYVKRKSVLTSNVQKAYSLVLGQCTDLMLSKIKSSRNWDAIKLSQDVLALLNEIKNISFKFEEHKYKPLSLHLEKMNYYSFRKANMSKSEYYHKFKNMVSTI